KDGTRDAGKILNLSQRLLNTQVKEGENKGGWSYSIIDRIPEKAADRSNAQFAVLGLHEAQKAGIPVNRDIWESIKGYWTSQQGLDGGWSYIGRGPGSTGSMTAAGITTQVIVESMLRDEKDVNPDGTLNCCGEPIRNESLGRAVKWLEQNFAVGRNPINGGAIGGTLYYLWGLERAGRFSGHRFFGSRNWYREGADFLIRNQLMNGSWNGTGHGEEPIVATCFSLLFLSKGLAPVLINKLEYEATDDDVKSPSWNRHPQEIRNLTESITGLPGWPKLMTCQQLSMKDIAKRGGLEDLMLSPILYVSGNKAPRFKPHEIELLRQYVSKGGLILGVATCKGKDFDQGFRQLIKEMYPEEKQQLKRLTAEHPVYRSEYPIDPEKNELWGVDMGNRTGIIYSPSDVGCLWNKWSAVEPLQRSPEMKTRITDAVRVGVNIVVYATGRKPPSPLENLHPDTSKQKER
ncbi:MAG: A-macroglobulin complement component, partial [Planctomycetaceae bacterium]|nr:A-macroglobulin complement component [Planctomycetaceae bacterium]